MFHTLNKITTILGMSAVILGGIGLSGFSGVKVEANTNKVKIKLNADKRYCITRDGNQVSDGNQRNPTFYKTVSLGLCNFADSWILPGNMKVVDNYGFGKIQLESNRSLCLDFNEDPLKPRNGITTIVAPCNLATNWNFSGGGILGRIDTQTKGFSLDNNKQSARLWNKTQIWDSTKDKSKSQIWLWE